MLSEFYSHWLSGFEISRPETSVDCSNCLMAREGVYRPDLKCCTYSPYVPNFAIGAIVQNGGLLPAHGILTPLGLFPSIGAQNSYAFNRAAESDQRGFGQDRDRLCPFFDTTQLHCSIWNHRPAVCATYFCLADRGGAETRDFWRRWRDYLNLFEWTLAHAALWRLGFTADETRRMAEVGAGGPSQSNFLPNVWYEYQTEPIKLFLTVAEAARQIGKEEVEELMGTKAAQERLALESLAVIGSAHGK